jgi:PGF-pre-PGF domain-containing protein
MWGTVEAGKATTWDLTNTQIAVKSIVFTPATAGTNSGLDVASLTKPSSLSAPVGKTVFQYLKMTASSLSVSTAKITFRIPLSWFNQNNVKRDTIKLLRYTSSWTELSTKETKTDASYAYYEATTPGFSYFAIVGTPTAVTTTETPTTETPTTETPTTETPTTETPTTGTPEDETVKKKSLAWLFWVVLILIIIVIAVFIFIQNKKGAVKKED